jgi:hypothetical protein
MTDIEIGQMDTTIEFEPELVTATPGPPALPGGAEGSAVDLARLRALLRPVIMELLEDELSRYTRMRG